MLFGVITQTTGGSGRKIICGGAETSGETWKQEYSYSANRNLAWISWLLFQSTLQTIRPPDGSSAVTYKKHISITIQL